jgi:hypothetical protein
MYSWIWRKLPGSKWLKLTQAVVLIAASLTLMYFFVFPFLDVVVFPETETEI